MFKKHRSRGLRLPYPVRKVPAGEETVEEYVIPEEDRARILDSLYPFDPVPALSELMYDLHEEKPFRVGEFRVIRGPVMDMLVSPYYFDSGGTVIDWMPPDFRPGTALARRIRGESCSLLTVSLGQRQRNHWA
jgi:hypothetical protein